MNKIKRTRSQHSLGPIELGLLVALLFNAMLASVAAGTIIPIDDDTYIDKNSQSANFSTENRGVVIDRSGGDRAASLLRFDLSSLTGKTEDDIQSATLQLAVTRVQGSPSIQLRGMNGDNFSTWVDASATWLRRDSSIPLAWSIVNGTGEFSGANYDSTFTQLDPDTEFSQVGGDYNPQNIGFSGYNIEFDVTDLLKEWVSGTRANNGVALIIRPSQPNANRSFEFYSQDGSPSLAPQLDVQLVVPEPSTSSFFLIGITAFLMLRNRRCRI